MTDQKLSTRPLPLISEEEQAERLYAVNFARGSMRYEGFIISDEAEAIAARYVSGELDIDGYIAALIRLSAQGSAAAADRAVPGSARYVAGRERGARQA